MKADNDTSLMSVLNRPVLERSFRFLLVALIFLVAFFIYPYALNDKLNDFGDSGQYVLLAQSLAQGEGYSNINHPGSPPHRGYPPLFSLSLVPAVFFTGVGFFWTKIPGILATFAFILLFFLWIRNYVDLTLALLVTLYLILSPHLLLYSQKIMSEPLFTVFLVSILFLASRPKVSPYWLGLSIAGAYLTRKFGTILLPAVIISLFSRPEFRSFTKSRVKQFWLPFLATVLLPVLAWSAREFFVQYDRFEVENLAPRGKSGAAKWVSYWFFHHIKVYSATVSQFIFPQIADLFIFFRPLVLFPWLLIASGLFFAWRMNIPVVIVVFLFYAGTLLVWPWTTYRFWIPAIPLLYFLFALPLSRVLRRGWAIALMIVLISVQFPKTAYLSHEIRTGKDRVPVYAVDYIAGIESLPEGFPPKDALVCAPEARIFSAMKGNQALSYHYPLSSPEAGLRYIKKIGASFLLYDPVYLYFQRGVKVPRLTDAAPSCFQLLSKVGYFEFYSVQQDCLARKLAEQLK